MSTMTVTRVPAAGVANGAATAADGSTPAGQQAAANGPAADGAPAGSTTLTLAKAINLGLRAALAADPRVLLMGEDIGTLGGVFRVTDGLQKEFGADRVVDTPLAESGIIGTAIGLAMRGYRPVCEIQFDGFVFPAFDQITTQLAKMHYRTRGKLSLPVVVRIPYGGGIGAVEHHSESPEVLFAHTAGLRVVTPATPADAFTMIQEAIASPDPVIFFEPKGRYWEKGEVDLGRPYGYSSRSFISEGGPKNPLKGTSMKFLVSARGAQPWVDSGSKECRAIHNGMWAMTLHSRRLFRFLKAKVENLFTSYHMG